MCKESIKLFLSVINGNMPAIFAYIRKNSGGFFMNYCKNLYFLSSIACMLAECLDEDELELLSTDLLTLGEMTESVLTHKKHKKTVCEKKPEDE